MLALGVAHFRVTDVALVDECTNPLASAGVSISEYYDSVSFEFDKQEVADADERTLDERIIHEWVHVAWRDYDRTVESLYRWLPEATRSDYEDALEHEYEGLIDRVARALYALYNESC